MSVDLSPVIAATTHWLMCNYPPTGNTVRAARAQAQAWQAVMAAAWLRYPTAMDVALLDLVGPGGCDRLDWVVGSELVGPAGEADAWRTWVDEVVTSWAACLLTDADLALAAVDAVADSEHASGLDHEFRRLITPDERDSQAAALLRHPDLLAPIANLHRGQLLERLSADAVEAA